MDPLALKYPWNSPYAFSENDVISAIELEGLEKVRLNLTSFAPFDLFGGGFIGDGKNRGFSLTQSKYKLSATSYYDVQSQTFYAEAYKGKAISEFVVADEDIYSGGKAVSETNIRTEKFEDGKLTFEAFAGNDAALQPLALIPLLKGKTLKHKFFKWLFKDVEVEILNSNIDIGTKISFDRNGSSLIISGNLYGDRFPSGQATITDESGQSLFLETSPILMKESINKEVAPFIMLIGNNKRDMGSFSITLGLDSDDNFNGTVIDNIAGISYGTLNDYNNRFENMKPVVQKNKE